MEIGASLAPPKSLEMAHVLFMDVVGFSKHPMDGQLALIDRLEDAVRNTNTFRQAVKRDELIRLPTGDGMALVFPGAGPPRRRRGAPATSPRSLVGMDIPVRMGINSGPVHPRADIRGGENVAGAGINHAQRAMDCGGAGHILLTDKTADILTELNQEWKDCIHPLGDYSVKHNLKLRLYNPPSLRGDGFGNSATPSRGEDPKRYFEILHEETAWIDIRGLQVGAGKAHRFPIRDLYTPLTTSPDAGGPNARKDGKQRGGPEEKTRGVPLEEALKYKRLVIVGDPGSGKSTFLKWMVCNPPESTFPILIRVPELAAHIRDSHGKEGPAAADNPAWLKHFLGARSADYHWGLSAEYFDHHLQTGCLLMVDGLDEAPNSAERETMAALIHNATQAYPSTRFVVTTRPQAYMGKTVLADFEQRQIADLLIPEAMQTFSCAAGRRRCNSQGSQASQEHFADLWKASSAAGWIFNEWSGIR